MNILEEVFGSDLEEKDFEENVEIKIQIVCIAKLYRPQDSL